jgi:methionyl-tRNA synthetase
MEIVTRCNAYVEETAPWKLAKDPTQAEKLDEVLYTLSESLRIISILMSPIIPREADAIRTQLNWQGDASLAAIAWGALPEGHQLSEPVPLFPRIEPQQE